MEITSKGRDSLYDSRLSCETSLVMRSEKRRMYSLAKGDTLTLKTGKRHEYNAKNLSVTPV